VLKIIKNNIQFKDDAYISTVFESRHSKTVLTSATSLKVCILRRCLNKQHLRMPIFKDVAEVSTVFENCSLSKMVFWNPSLKFLSFDDVTFNDLYLGTFSKSFILGPLLYLSEVDQYTIAIED